MKSTEERPQCPWCGTSKHVRTSGTNLKAFYCASCRCEFEAGDDGVIGYGRPEKFAERTERARWRPPWRRRR